MAGTSSTHEKGVEHEFDRCVVNIIKHREPSKSEINKSHFMADRALLASKMKGFHVCLYFLPYNFSLSLSIHTFYPLSASVCIYRND